MTLKNLDDVIQVQVRANAPKTEYKDTLADGTIKLALKAPREWGKANTTLVKFLKKETGDGWRILSGKTASRKKLKREKK